MAGAITKRMGSRRGAARATRLRLAISLGMAWAAVAAVPVMAQSSALTPASGPSLVSRLKAGVDWTAFGRAGEGSAATDPTALAANRPAGDWLVRGFELTGADLYRINCRSCHGPDGRGARSGIPPLVGALEKPAIAPDEPTAEVRARHRLVDGGRVMPNFVHLERNEVDLLFGHLRSLTPPGAPSPAGKVRQSALRVGEHLVKATCQVCHDAAPGPTRMPADLAVPTLADMVDKYAAREFVRKTRAGSLQADGSHGRMPRFDYLTTEELDAAYVYLIAYPPIVAEK